jgi:hypothetical protein
VPEGKPVLQEEPPTALGDFEGTVFEAALDAEKGRPWARNGEDGPVERYWGVQGRHLHRAVRLLGLAPATGERLRELLAAVLSVACMLLRDGSRTVHRGYRSRGKAVCDVLRALSWGNQRAIRLLFCGYVVGLWARPWTWDPERRCLETLPFQAPGMPAPT